MKALALLIGLAMAALGLATLVTPEVLIDLARRFATPVGLYIAAAIRLAVGVLLLGLASRSRSPIGLRVIGGLTFFAGIVTPFIGVERARDYVAWWSGGDAIVLRLWSIVAIALGLFIAWAVLPVRRPLRPRPAT